MFVPGKLFKSSLMFVGKARSLPYGTTPKKVFHLIGSNLLQNSLPFFHAIGISIGSLVMLELPASANDLKLLLLTLKTKF